MYLIFFTETLPIFSVLLDAKNENPVRSLPESAEWDSSKKDYPEHLLTSREPMVEFLFYRLGYQTLRDRVEQPQGIIRSIKDAMVDRLKEFLPGEKAA
jgi:hypothetical protein